MELILIRHGKAESRSDNKPDPERELTASGLKKLELTMPALGNLVKGIFQAQLWSSPHARTAQTAELISDKFHLPDIKYFDFIANGDFNALIRALEKADSSRTIILVGHEPFLSDWCARLCDMRLPFKKGAAAGLEITDTDPAQADLMWFMQPSVLSRITASRTCP